MTPSPITADITVGDYLCFLFGGTSAGNLPIELMDKNNIVNSMFKFSFPSIWILIYTWKTKLKHRIYYIIFIH